MSNLDGKHSKLKQKLFADFPKWFRGHRKFKKWFPKGNSTHPYDWEYYDENRRFNKYSKDKIEQKYKINGE